MMSLLLIPVLGFSLFPESEKPIITIDIETEPGSNLTHTDKVVRKVEQKLLTFTEIDHISANAGKGNPRIYYNEFQRQNSANFGQIIVYLNEKTKVPDIIRFADKARSDLARFPGVKIEVKRFQQGPPISAPIEMRIMGNNLDTLDILSTKVEKLMKEKSGSMYVRNDLKYVKSDIVVRCR
jgi:multidrug efflux pump subunit AcrB